MGLTKENTFIDMENLTPEQRGTIFDVISKEDDWSAWDRDEFINSWGREYDFEHNTIAYDEENLYNSVAYYQIHDNTHFGLTEINFEQWLELHAKEEIEVKDYLGNVIKIGDICIRPIKLGQTIELTKCKVISIDTSRGEGNTVEILTEGCIKTGFTFPRRLVKLDNNQILQWNKS